MSKEYVLTRYGDGCYMFRTKVAVDPQRIFPETYQIRFMFDFEFIFFIMFKNHLLLSHFQPQHPPSRVLCLIVYQPHYFQGDLLYSHLLHFLVGRSLFPLPKPSVPALQVKSGFLALIPVNSLTCFLICAALWLPHLSTTKYMPRFHLVQCIFIGNLLYAKALINHCGKKKR